MEGLRGQPKAPHFGVDGRTAPLGVFQLFQDDAPSTLPEDKAAAIFIEGARRCCWVIVELQGMPMNKRNAVSS